VKWRVTKHLRVLDFDLENRPLTYLGSDFTTADITAIAWSWYGDDQVYCYLLTGRDGSQHRMLTEFVKAYDQADIVTGHYIRKHDLPHINGALLEHKLPVLGPKLTSDTKIDLVKRSGISASQENLAGMYDLSQPKEHMSQTEWRRANRLTTDGVEETRRRVQGDVIQHKALRQRLIEAGALGPPRLWTS
jgi:hypothetical protein